MKKKPTYSFLKFVRMWHYRNGEWCHAWDVSEPAFRLWREGKVVLSAYAVKLPDGEHPQIPTRIVCGTCGSTDINPNNMKVEFKTS